MIAEVAADRGSDLADRRAYLADAASAWRECATAIAEHLQTLAAALDGSAPPASQGAQL